MYFEDADGPASDADDSTAGADDEEPRFAIQANVSIYGARIGVGFVPDADSEGDRSQLRLLLGVDLIKLLTGRNLEVASTNF
jgi:hypothetical protein